MDKNKSGSEIIVKEKLGTKEEEKEKAELKNI